MSSNTARPVLHRKRTSSFSFPSSALAAPRPLKAQRTLPAIDTAAPMGTLTRTTSYLTIPAVLNDTYTAPSDPLPYHRTLRYYKEQRERRKSLLIVARHIEPPVIAVSIPSLPTASSPAPSEPAVRVRLPHAPSAPSAAPAPKPPASLPAPSPAPPPPNTPFRPAVRRPTSPLAPVRTPRPPRLAFPRSRPEPDLYRKAITARMRGSPEGQKILLMGARLAVSILTATRELERIVARNNLESEDVTMEPSPPPVPPPLTNSWVIVPGEDWEMVDCSA